ncbi:MAG: hypothetical protein VKL39_16375 [Leptolyngbyaceae bacterium]|nr:hypothetical protein [Leptolyngbyaceae bacterium]
MPKEPNSLPQTPAYVADLQAIYGAPSQAGFGSAVFYESINNPQQIEQVALKTYRYFVGELWERWGEAAWMMTWKEVYQRQPDASHRIVSEMQAVSDSDAAMSLSMILTVGRAEAAHQALAAAYDDATVTDLVIYTIGDGAAMSGVLVVGRRATGATTLLIFLLD